MDIEPLTMVAKDLRHVAPSIANMIRDHILTVRCAKVALIPAGVAAISQPYCNI